MAAQQRRLDRLQPGQRHRCNDVDACEHRPKQTVPFQRPDVAIRVAIREQLLTRYAPVGVRAEAHQVARVIDAECHTESLATQL